MKNLFVLLTVMIIAVSSCKDSATNPDKKIKSDILKIKSTWKAYECTGYCIQEVTFDSAELRNIQKWFYDYKEHKPDIDEVQPMNNKTWEDIVQDFEMKKMLALPDRIPCQKCYEDLPLETLEVTTQDTTKKITFQQTDSIPQLEPFLSKVRALRVKMLKD